MDEVRGVNEADAAGLCFGEHFGEGAEGFGVRVADGDGFPFFLGVFEGKRQLVADGAHIANVVKERHVAGSGVDAVGARGVEGDGGGGGAAVDEEEIAAAEQRHQFIHELGVGSGERALMIVDAGGVRNGGEHAV